mgnify:CR=1 FL=1
MTSIDQTWAARAACANVEPDQLFGKGAEQRDARSLCFTCPVRMECLAEALDSESAFGAPKIGRASCRERV